jgi:hypothetical protein
MLLIWGAAGWTVPEMTRPSQVRTEIIRTEFRVFHGNVEVSGETRLRVRPSGSTETGRVIEGAPLAADLPVGIYDVQAVRQRSGEVVSVRWAEQLHVMAYPDEGGRHLEVINFADEYGALQLRWPDGDTPDPATVTVAVTRGSQQGQSPSRVIHGKGYVLLVLPAGTYDVRIARRPREPVVLTQIEIPADRTRMKLIQ